MKLATLIPGLIVIGLGSGLVQTPLANLAVGVVEPRRAGMASGINSTFRQVGIAAGVAALGSIFASQIRSGVSSGLAGTSLAHSSHQIAKAVSAGRVGQVIAHLPAASRGRVAAVSTSSFVHALNDILLIAAVVAFAGAVAAVALIRQRDFVDASQQAISETPPSPNAAPAMEHVVS